MARNAANGVPRSPDERKARTESETGSTLGRLPPQNLEAERATLSSILIAPWFMDELITRLSEDDFYGPANRLVFIAMKNIHAAGRKVDSALVVDRLKRMKADPEFSWVAYLLELVDFAPHANNCLYYADIVKECSMRRSAIHAMTDALREAYDDGSPIKGVVAKAERTLADINAARDSDQLVRIVDVATSRYNKMIAKKAPRRAIATGIYKLDKILDGYEPGQLTILAARTSVGKTALATSHCAHWLQATDLVGYFASLEMSAEEVTERILVNMAEIDLYRFRNHYLQEAELERLKAAIKELTDTNRLFIDHAPQRTVGEIVAMARRSQRVHNRLDYVIVDYLQLIDGDNRYQKRHEQVSAITRSLKLAAKELDVPFIVLAQLNREADQGKPRLSHLRESGSIEQDADKVIFIDRPSEGTGSSMAELIVAKNRHGKVGDCQAAFFGSYQRFQGLAADADF